MPHRTAFRGARLLDPATGLDQQGDLIVEDGKILALGPGIANDGSAMAFDTIIPCNGLCLAPGLIDLRVETGEPGYEHIETISSASAAAAAGGVTTFVCMPGTSPPIDTAAGVGFIIHHAQKVGGGVRVLPAAAATRGLEGRQLTDMGHLAEAGAVAFTDGRRPIADARLMLAALGWSGAFARPLIQHPEEPSLAAGGVMHAGRMATRLGLPGIPTAAEVIMIERDMHLLAIAGGRYHAAHIATAAGVDAIRRARSRGLPVTCDTAPPYFLLTDEDVGEYRSAARLSPPLRSLQDREAVIAGLKDGTIDAIVSDHQPCDGDMKRLPFSQAAPGAVGLETLLPLTLELVHQGQLSLSTAIARLTCGPAAVLNRQAGRLAIGAAADLVLFDLQHPWQVEGKKFRSLSRNTPFEGRMIRGQVVRTVVGGSTVFDRTGAEQTIAPD